MKSKKGVDWIFSTIVAVALLLLFFVSYSTAWGSIFKRGASSLNDQFSSAGDCDKDNVINVADKCPCQPGEIENNGCPSKGRNENRDCLKNKDCIAKKT